MKVPHRVRRLVSQRAEHRCECCRVRHAEYAPAPFHIEHIVARQHHGPTEPANLALACHHCNAFKGPNLSAVDSKTGQVVRLFNPRVQAWEDHFRQVGGRIIGRTDIGRATVDLLQMNDTDRVALRLSQSQH